MAFRDFFRGDRDHEDDRSFRDRIRSMSDEWRERERAGEWRDRDRERDWDREPNRPYGFDRDRGDDFASRLRWEPGSEYGEDRSRSYGGERDQDYERNARREAPRRWSTSADSPWGGGSYTGTEDRREFDQGTYRRYYGGGGSGYGSSGYGGESWRQSGGSFGEGGYGRDIEQGRRGAVGYGGYGGMGGAETGSSAGAWSQSQQETQWRHRGKGPRGYRRSDERIREEVCDCLTDDPHIDASNLEVTVKDCDVTLSGTVNSREEKRHAEDLVERISGVKDVTNNLRVTTQTGAPGGSENVTSPAARH